METKQQKGLPAAAASCFAEAGEKRTAWLGKFNTAVLMYTVLFCLFDRVRRYFYPCWYRAGLGLGKPRWFIWGAVRATAAPSPPVPVILLTVSRHEWPSLVFLTCLPVTTPPQCPCGVGLLLPASLPQPPAGPRACPPPGLPQPGVVSHLNEQLDSFISYKRWIRLIALIPLGVANWFYPRMYHFSGFLFFSSKEKEPLRQQASPEWKIKNLDITYLAALLPAGLWKTQLNVSPLNTALQHIKQKILQAWWPGWKLRLKAVPCSFL